MPKTKEINQEQIFKFLWPDKCWKHQFVATNELYAIDWSGGYEARTYYVECDTCSVKENPTLVSIHENPDLKSPSGMVMILDRLEEMGWKWCLTKGVYGRTPTETYVYIGRLDGNGDVSVERSADTAPLAVLNAVQALMEKEEKE